MESARLDGVDEWEAQRLAKVREDAQARRERHRVAAGRALQQMRLRGESISAIAQLAGISVAAVRGFLQAAVNDAPSANTPLPGTWLTSKRIPSGSRKESE